MPRNVAGKPASLRKLCMDAPDLGDVQSECMFSGYNRVSGESCDCVFSWVPFANQSELVRVIALGSAEVSNGGREPSVSGSGYSWDSSAAGRWLSSK